jgi:hypothetical protein
MNWPSGYIVRLNGEDIDGQGNELVSHGSDAYLWHNSGSFATSFTRASVAGTPLIKKLSGSSVVSFDGRSDILQCAGSAAALAFIHTTGIFDLAIVMRRMATRSSGVRILGTEGKGLGLYSSVYNAGVTIEGGFQLFLNNGSIPITTLATQRVNAPIGAVSSLFVRGTGTKIRCTQNFWDWEEQTFLGALGSGSAAHDYAIGSTGGNPGDPDDFACVDVFDLLLWSAPLSDSDLDVVQANFATRSSSP